VSKQGPGLTAVNPFKAAQSYGPADGDLFFGRDVEGVALARFFQDRRVGVLTAASGIGKTSLLNARVIPLLERDRWSVASGRPREDPIEALRSALADYLFPDPRKEADVAAQLADAMPDNDPELQSALQWHENLPPHQRAEFRLFAPSAIEDLGPLPIICRALRKSMAIDDVIEQFEALVAEGTPLGLTPQTKLHEIIELLRRPDVIRLRDDWRNRFAQTRGLSRLLSLLEEEWLPLRPGTAGILLILDQAEEVFTRLPASKLDELMAEARVLMDWSVNGVPRPYSKPVHLAFSLRKEFFADLVPRLRPFGQVDRLTYFLGALTLDEARLALGKPAQLFLEFGPALGNAPATLDRILTLALDRGAETEPDDAASADTDGLTLPEGPRYSPFLISLIGDHLWTAVQGERRKGRDVGHPLDWREFRRLLPRLDSVFEGFLAKAMSRIDAKLDVGSTTRFDILELLDRLVTATGYRNIVQEEELISQLPLKADEARALLELVDHDLKLIRRESRRGGRLVEIMHEKLIPPVRRLLNDLRRQDILRGTLLSAYDMLQVLPDEPNVTSDPLPPHFRDALVQHLDRLDLDFLSTKILLRSVLVSGPGKGQDAGARWKRAVRRLTVNMDNAPRTPAIRETLSLLYGAELDEELVAFAATAGACDLQAARRLALSALADRSGAASARVRRTFRALVGSELLT
jgi:hypothetical protein